MTNLTEQWKKGELDRNKIYYYETPFNTVDTASGYWLCNHLDTEKDKVEILGEVPSFKEYQKLLSDQLAKNEGVEINAELKAENTKLKELLKLNNVLDKGLKSILVWLKEETQGEQKELCEQLYKDTLEMMSKINQVLGEE